jgi:hypothetical protein
MGVVPGLLMAGILVLGAGAPIVVFLAASISADMLSIAERNTHVYFNPNP